MPKKFPTENTKVVAARDRKRAAKDVENTKKQQDLLDQHWSEDNKNLLKKEQRKQDREKKRQEQLERKAEAKALLQQEMNSIKSPPLKLTRTHISSTIKSGSTKIEDVPLVENLNRISFDGDEARTVDEAICILSSDKSVVDKHPEKRLKAAYNAFEERRLKELKEQNPSLRLTQLKQIISKEWQKSADNPLNIRF